MRTPQTAGTAFGVTVNGCDEFWNVVPGAVATVRLETDCLYFTTPTLQGRASGVATFSNAMTLNARTTSGWTITARDVDFAEESANFTKNSILVQSSAAMLAQANQLPQAVLKLLG